MVKRRGSGEPVAYVVGHKEFYSLQFKVNEHVLIPRPETEEIIEYAIEAVQKSNIKNLDEGDWVDLGTGSGAIACGLAEVFPNIMIHAVDYSEAALKIAQENAQNLGFSERIKFYQGDWWQPLQHLKGKVKAMISNPPYIPTQELPKLQTEVIKHEPVLALDGGENGLKDINYLINSAKEYLCDGGIFLIEIMKSQGKSIEKLLKQQGNYQDIKICFDYEKADRFAMAYYRKI